MREARENQELYVLLGDTRGLNIGDDVVVEGTLSESRTCSEGTVLWVTRHTVKSGASCGRCFWERLPRSLLPKCVCCGGLVPL